MKISQFKNHPDSLCLSYEQMVNYLDKQLSPLERTKVEDHIKECDLCSEALDGLRMIEDREHALQTVMGLKQDISMRLSRAHKRSVHMRRYLSWAASFLVVAITSFIFINFQPENERVFAENFEPYPNVIPVLRGENQSHDFENAITAYEKENYSDAVDRFNSMVESSPGNMTYRFYCGISRLAKEDISGAINDFKSIYNNRESRWREPASWYLGLSYIKIEDYDNARFIFDEIIKDEGYYKQKCLDIIESGLFKKQRPSVLFFIHPNGVLQ